MELNWLKTIDLVCYHPSRITATIIFMPVVYELLDMPQPMILRLQAPSLRRGS